jgi:hypothetical protein
MVFAQIFFQEILNSIHFSVFWYYPFELYDHPIVIFLNNNVSLYQVHLTIHRAHSYVLVISQIDTRILTGTFLSNIARLSSDDSHILYFAAIA